MSDSDLRSGDLRAEPRLVLLDETESTNDDALRLAMAGAPHATAVAARSQTAGRGRRGHAWESPKGGVYLSVLLRPRVPTRLLSGAPVVCGLGVLDVVRGVGVAHARLKWPNDVVVEGRKLAGLLVEAVPAPGSVGSAIVCGVGLNLTAPSLGERALSGRGPGACGALEPTGLCEAFAAEGGAREQLPSFEQLARLLREAIVRRCDEWTRVGCGAGPLSSVLDEYHAQLAFRGAQVEAVTPSGETACVGRFEGVDEWGRAVVAHDGTTSLLTSEQVSLRPAPPATGTGQVAGLVD